MAVVVVESPAKAKTINKYLGSNYTVLASYGHVRDLPKKDGSVKPDEDFAMEWELDSDGSKRVTAIAKAIKESADEGDDKLILATDPDREGEAISWHLLEALRKRRAVRKTTSVERVVFNAITKTAVTDAMKNPREIDQPLVDAYLARRALDYLVGFTLSPVLWRKLPGSRSAGRVQSVALRLVVEREMEIEKFKAREYWSITVEMTTPSGAKFTARLAELNGEKLDKFALGEESAALRAVAAVEARDFAVASVEAKPATRNPFPPFTTSTLQQEASRKLHMSPKQTMATAQKLYEAGHITYMRTDGVDMAPEAIEAARQAIKSDFGAAYLPAKARVYKSKQKNAQEAHECIRPTDMTAAPQKLAKLEADMLRLYDLIWKRAIASQMESARLERTAVDVKSPDGAVGLRATGQVVKFDGFLKLYQEDRDESAAQDADEEESDGRLPAMAKGDALGREKVTPAQHFTQPPPRFSEAALVKRMEELGIGRPSTYASIISVIQDREYVRKEKSRLVPEDKGRLVTAFLENFFERYVEYSFTANLEESLDDVSGGREEWKEILRRFWEDFHATAEQTLKLRNAEVIDKVNDALADHIFPEREDGAPPRQCPLCNMGQLSLKPGKFGAFIGCSNYPECKYTRQLGGEEGPAEAGSPDGKLLGQHPESGQNVTLRTGRFGPYVQHGEPPEGSKEKPQRSSLPKGIAADDVDLDLAVQLLSLPRNVGPHPEDGEMITAGLGRFGPFVKHGSTYANLPEWRDALEVGVNRAVTLIAEKREKGGGRRGAAVKPLRELGAHPEDGEQVALFSGRYGPYVKHGKINATLPKDADPEKVTLEEALALITAKAEKSGKAKKAPAKKAPAKKAKAKAEKADSAEAEKPKKKSTKKKAAASED
ncbi:MAG: type I DNA topoisomerase [Neomegalonema sp.]|nr:type I DNA topoisomerase [Neomegalonema sp.]